MHQEPIFRCLSLGQTVVFGLHAIRKLGLRYQWKVFKTLQYIINVFLQIMIIIITIFINTHQNTEKNPGDLKPAVTQTPVRNNRLTLARRTLKIIMIIIVIIKRTYQHWGQRWRIVTTTRRLHRKARRKTDYSHQKQYQQHEDQKNRNNQKKTQLYGRFK